MYSRYIFVSFFILLLCAVCFQVEANTTLIEKISEQNDVQILERTYYDYDVEQIMFTYPDKDIEVDIRGRIDPLTISSVDISDRNIWLCSSIARKNIQQVVNLPYYAGFSANNSSISQQDAVWLIQQGSQKLLRYEEDELLPYLNEMHAKYGFTIVDLYVYKPNGVDASQVKYTTYEDATYQKYIQQGHRVMVFLGTDNSWYVLDPLRGEKIVQPQSLGVYVTLDEFDGWTWLIPTYAYSPTSHIYKYIPVSFTIDLFTHKNISRVHISQTPIHYFPSDRSQILGSLERGTALEIIEHSNNWYKVKNYDGVEGWILGDNVVVESYAFEKKNEDLLPDFLDMYVRYIRFLHTKI